MSTFLDDLGLVILGSGDVGPTEKSECVQLCQQRGRARGATPRMLNFTPYASDELRSILLQRLASAKLSPVDSNRFGSSDAARHDALIDRNAVDFCCKKVANASGDARRVLEV
jgi:Cdc6-like AAA superfamily ATPase